MKTTKRFVALLMAVVMVFALSAVALAQNGVKTTLDPGPSFTIQKGVIMVNNTEGKYTRPAVKFDFDIISGKSLDEDTDLAYAPHVSGVKVYAGLPGGLKGSNETNTNSTQTATEGTTTGDTLTPFKTSISFDALDVEGVNNNYGKITTEPLKFVAVMAAYDGVDQPGVYRYKVTDVTPESYLQQVGISRDKDYHRDSYIDLYIQINNTETGPEPSVAAVVISQVEDSVPIRNSNGNIEATSTTDSSTKEFDPGKVYVEDDGTVWELKNGAPQNPVFPRDYTETTYVVPDGKMDKGLVKTEDVFNDHPEYDFTDDDGDEVPDEDENHTPKDKTNTTPARDDQGNFVGQDNKSYPEDEYEVKPDGKIVKKSDGSDPEGGPVYAKYVGNYDYEQSDVYETFNVIITKNTSGPMGDKTHEFPFKLTVNNTTAEGDPQNLPFVNFKNSENPEDPRRSGSQVIATSLKHEDKYTIRGLNANAKINIEETNDTSFAYKVTMTTSDNNAKVDSIPVKINGGKVMLNDQGDEAVATLNDQKVFTATSVDYIRVSNVQNDINPTGVVLRFAPYILMLGAAFFFVALSRRRREQENA